MVRASENIQQREGSVVPSATPSHPGSSMVTRLGRGAAAAALSVVAACNTYGTTSGQGFYGGHMTADASSGSADAKGTQTPSPLYPGPENCETPVQHNVAANYPFAIFSANTNGIMNASGGAVQEKPVKYSAGGKYPYYYSENLQSQLAQPGEDNKFHLLVTVHPQGGSPAHQINMTDSMKGNGVLDRAPGIYIKLDRTLSKEEVTKLMIAVTTVLKPLKTYKSLLEARNDIEAYIRGLYPDMVRSYRAGNPDKHNAEDKNPATGMTVLSITLLQQQCQ